MGWVRLEDDFYDNEKIAAAGPLGIALWVAGLAYCNRNLTDGFIPESRARLLLDFDGLAEGNHDVSGRYVADLLVTCGLWDEVRGDEVVVGYQIHDYHDYQPSSEDVRGKRADVSAKRAEAGRRGAEARWKQPDAKSDGKTMANAWQTDGPNPNPNPISSLTSSLVSNEVVHTPVDDDDGDIGSQAIKILARRQLARRVAEKGPVGDEDAWLAAAVDRLTRKHASRIVALLATGPPPLAGGLVDMLEPPLAPLPAAPAAPDPYKHFPNWTRERWDAK